MITNFLHDHRSIHDLWRTTLLLAVGVLLLKYSVAIAQWAGEPDLAAVAFRVSMAFFSLALIPVAKRVLMAYVDLRVFTIKAKEDPRGAGLVVLGVCILMAAFVSLFTGSARAASLPPNAVRYLPILKMEQSQFWDDMPVPSVIGALVEQETCISLKSKRCWSPDAELKTDREQGIGLGQITRTAKFDALAELRAKYPQELGEWGWDKPTLRDPHYQLRGVVLLERQCWRGISGAFSDEDHAAFMDACYNGGAGGIAGDRKICAATKGCDARRWFGHVERTSLKKKTAVSGYGKSFFEINREHVRNVLVVRRSRYAGVLT